MKKIYFFKYFITLLFSVSISAALHAQNFKLIDINKTKNSNPSNYYKNKFAVLKGVFYFSADDGIHGRELYGSDGTAEGTQLVKDISPGTASSFPDYFPSNITAAGDKIYFITSDNTYSNPKLWVSDGTDAGTKMLNNFSPGLYPSFQNLTDVNGSLYFTYNFYDSSYIGHTLLWKTNGTDSGTVMVDSLNGSFGSAVNVNGKLFFTFYDYSALFGSELYISDGTAEGTKIVADINPNPYSGSNPSHLTALHGLLYFAADDGTGNKLWVSDGTAEGTHALKNKNNIYLPFDYSRDPFAIRNNTLFFQGTNYDSTTSTASGTELCKYNTSDTNTNNVQLVKDIVPGENSSYPSFMTNVNGTLFFTIGPANADAQLWKSDGTKAGTVLVKDINPGGKNYYYNLINYKGTLLFDFGTDTIGTELWKSNGTSAGTVRVKDILPGAAGSFPDNFTYKNSIFLFSANGPKGRELWRSDGTEAGTVMVKDINHTSTSTSYAHGFTRTTNQKVVFSATNGKDPGNLFVTDGTDAGTKRVDTSVYPQYFYNAQLTFINFKNNIYFIDYSNHLWKTNGTKSGTSQLRVDFVNNQSDYIQANLITTSDLLYILIYNYSTGITSLWRTDGTAPGTYVLKSDLPSYYPLYPTAVGNTLFFSNFNNNTYTNELWKTDGTVAGTQLVKAMNSYNYNPLANLYNYKGKLYFSAYTPTNSFGPSLWTSDGTEAGTKVVKDILVAQQQSFAQANGKFFLYAVDAISKGYELFVSDGTAGGTRIVKDINRGGASSNSYFSAVSGDTIVYFTADDGKHGPELWKSDGTSEGTKLVKDITKGVNGTYLTNMVNVKDNLFFTINDTLWQSDGTKVNTHPVRDDNLKGVTQLNNLTAIGDSLYFSGYTYAAGQELYVGSAKIDKAPSVILSIPDSIVKYTAPARIQLNAAATDEDGTITKVEFYNGTTLLHTEYATPYRYLWKDVPVGNYTLTARATDNSGNVAISNSIKVSVVPNQPPTVSIITPANHQTYTFPDTIHIKAAANDPDGKIAKVEFYNGTTLLHTEHYYPYTYHWHLVPPGTYTITAVATDDRGVSTTSAPVTVTVLSNGAIVSSRPSSADSKTGILSLRLAPNPASHTLQVYTTGLQKDKPSTIAVISVSGVVLKTMQSNSSNRPIQLDVSSLVRGVYIIKVINGDKVMYNQFVKL